MRYEAGQAPPVWRVGDVIDGRYEVGHVHDSGGMGLVYRVRQLEWGTDLAVKSPRPELIRDEADRRRFVAEAEAWVSLGLHPNVCACEYVRTLGGIPRVFAEYVHGGSLHDLIAGRALYRGDPARVLARVLDLAIQTAWGLEHSHAKGLVHQDVKPHNVLVDRDGTAKVTDFGLARAGSAGPGTTAAAPGPGASVLVTSGGLTRAYASPEQLAGARLGRRTDVFSFAVSVLEMFTGGVSWMFGPAAAEALELWREEGPDEPGLPALPRVVARLLGRCLREDPAARPASMAEVADELAGIYAALTGGAYPRTRPVAADLRADEHNNRALSLLDLGRPADAAAELTAALRADPAHLEATYNAGLIRWRRGEISDEDLVAEIERAGTGERAGVAGPLLAQVHLERGDRTSALALLDRAGPDDPEAATLLDLLGSGRITDAGCLSVRRPPWDRRPSPSSAGGPSVDDVVLVPGANRVVAGDEDGVVRVWNLDTGAVRPSLDRLDGNLRAIAVGAGGRYAVSRDPRAARFWDLDTGRCLRVFTPPDDDPDPGDPNFRWRGDVRRRRGREVVSVHIDAAGALPLAVDGAGRVWDLRTGRLRMSLHPRRDSAYVVLNATARRMLSGGAGDGCRLWDLDSGECLRVLPGEFSPLISGAISDDGRLALIRTLSDQVGVWDLGTGTRVRLLPRASLRGTTAPFTSDARRVLTGHEGAVRLWDLETGRCLRTFRGHDDTVGAVLLDEDGETALSAGRDGTVRRWRLPGRYAAPFRLGRPRPHAKLNRLDARADALIAEARQARLAGRHGDALGLLTRARALPGQERAPRVQAAWREMDDVTARTGPRAPWQRLALKSEPAMAVALAADRPIAALGGSNQVEVWDLDTGARIRLIADRPSLVGAVALGADGETVLSATRDGEVAVWSVATGECLTLLDGLRTMGARDAAWSADGALALIGSAGDRVTLWDLAAGERRAILGRHPPQITSLWISPDGRTGASAGADGVARIWDLHTGECRRELRGHTHWVGSVAVSPDERLALTSGMYDDRTIRLWDLATGRCARVFADQPDIANDVRFTPDGRFAVSAGEDSRVRIWDIATGRCLRALEGHEGAVRALALSRDGWLAVSGGADGTLRAWELDWELAALSPRRG